MKNTAIVLSAASATKLAPSRIARISWADAKKMFGLQVRQNPCSGQRNQKEQVEHGWKHIKGDVLTSQSTIQAIEFKGAYGARLKKSKGVSVKVQTFMGLEIVKALTLIDGYHRLYYWMSLEEHHAVLSGCPFEALNLEIHEVYADDEEEARLKTDELARSYNSLVAAKRPSDFLSAAVREAGLVAVSAAYKTGTGSGVKSFLSRVIGKGDMPTPKMEAKARKELHAHRFVDTLLAQVESTSRLRALRGQMFNPGVMQAMFEHALRLEAEDQRMLALQQVTTALNIVARPNASGLKATKVETDLAETLLSLTNTEFVTTIRSTGNRETQYNFIRAMLMPHLKSLGSKKLVKAKTASV